MFDAFPDVMTVKEAASALRIGRNRLYDLVRNGSISAFKNGKTILIPKKNILAYIDSMCYNNNYIKQNMSPERSTYGDE